MQIRRARKKPVEIELVEFKSFADVDRIVAWVGSERAWYDNMTSHIVIATLEGNHKANLGDWIIKGVKGEFYPIKPDILTATYDFSDASREDSNG